MDEIKEALEHNIRTVVIEHLPEIRIEDFYTDISVNKQVDE